MFGATLGMVMLAGCRDGDVQTAAASALAAGAVVAWADTVAGDLAAHTSTTLVAGAAVDVAIARGYRTPGDGGGGIFFWDPALAADDHGTAILPAGSLVGGWRRLFDGAYNLLWFGAIPGDDSAAARAANSQALQWVQDAMQNVIGTIAYSWGAAVFVPPGRFHLAGSVRITRALTLFGTGTQGESILSLPLEASLIIEADPAPPGTATPLRGSDCIIRDLQIVSERNWQYAEDSTVNLDTFEGASWGTPGIVMHDVAVIERVFVCGFSGTGILVQNVEGTDANYCRIRDVYINRCGGHGVHTEGGEAQGGLIAGVKAIAIGGNGFYESSFGGNTYVACYAYVARGRGFFSDSVGQVTFTGCASEADHPTHVSRGGAVWLGGSSAGFHPEALVFAVEGQSGVRPFGVPHVDDPTVRLVVGYHDPQRPAERAVLGWQAGDEGGAFWLVRYLADLHIWSTELGNNLPTGQRVAYQTAYGHARGGGLQGFPSLLLGPADAAMQVTTTATLATAAPPFPGAWNHGDVVYNAAPAPGDPIGWVYIPAASPAWRSFGSIEP